MKRPLLALEQASTCSSLHLSGDGVNDVAAMKTADVAVALLNGFGAEVEELEGDQVDDIDDQRRKMKLETRKIGSNRIKRRRARNRMLFLESPEAQARVVRRIKEVQEEVARRAAAREGIGPNSTSKVQYNLGDIRFMVSGIITAIKEERNRAKSLRLGGGEAARILAQEQRSGGNVTSDGVDPIEMLAIKPGEASLVASFSCLRPSIDGVASILRAGIASAACWLSTQQHIALHSLMASYNLASLYRDGFRYGKFMWPVELVSYLLIEQASYLASCTARPRLPPSRSLRPPTSLFHPSSVFSTVAQAVIHVVSLTSGVNYGHQLESLTKDNQVKRSLIRSAKSPAITSILAQLSDALAMKLQMGDAALEEYKYGIFGRPAFRPNYETNVVFIFSILQGAVSSLINHTGKPFYWSVLESRQLCLFAGLSILFAVACMTESFPSLNQMVELRRLPSRRAKFVILFIAAADVAACILCRQLSALFFHLDSGHNRANEGTIKEKHVVATAADFEETLLHEEANQNRTLVLLMTGVLVNMLLEALLRT